MQSDVSVIQHSSQGGVLLSGGNSVFLQGVQVDAARDITIQGGNVIIQAATNSSSVTSTTGSRTKGIEPGQILWHDPSTGINAKKTTETTVEDSTLTRTTLNGANVSITAADTLALAGTTVNTPGALTLNADTLILGTQTTEHSTQTTSAGRDLAYQKTKDSGQSDQTTNYNQFNVGTLAVNANHIQAGLGARDSLEALGKQPGMQWVQQLTGDPNLNGKIDWQRVEEAHKRWDEGQQGLTPEGAAIVTLVTVYFTAGAASGWGAAAGDAAATAATGGGVAALGEGAFIAAGGVTVSGVVGGAVTAGITALASQAAVALINNQGDIGAALEDLGSSASVRNLLTAIVTGGVLGGLNMNPTGLPTTGAGADGFMRQLGQNLQAGAARAVIGTAINGGSLESNLRDALKTAILDTAAAQVAHAIGDLSVGDNAVLNAFTNKVAHAIAGCAVGAARADNSGGCAAGALGAAIGEMAAEAYGRQFDTTQFAAMISGIAVAIAGGDASQINLGSQAGANAAANNYLNHDQWKRLANRLNTCTPGADCDKAVQDARDLSAKQDKELVLACQDINSEACRGKIIEGRQGSAAQAELVSAGKLPDHYFALGNDLNANVNLYANSAFMSDLRAECARNVNCDQKKTETLLKLGSLVLDFTPGVSDIKAFVEAETHFDYLLATIGIAGPIGDGAAKALREGRALYKAGDVAGSTAKLNEAKNLQDVAQAASATPTGAGYINKTLIGKGGAVLNTPTADQRLMISDIVANGDRAGTKTEALFENVLKGDPSITVLGGTKYGSNNGLDHVVQFVDPQTGKTMTMVIDSKQLTSSGATRLSNEAAGTAAAGSGVMQLSDQSLDVIVGRLGNTSAARAIRSALVEDTLVKAVAYVDKSTGELRIVRVNP